MKRRVVTGPLQDTFSLCWAQLGRSGSKQRMIWKFSKAFLPKCLFHVILLLTEMLPLLESHPALPAVKRQTGLRGWGQYDFQTCQPAECKLISANSAVGQQKVMPRLLSQGGSDQEWWKGKLTPRKKAIGGKEVLQEKRLEYESTSQGLAGR